VVVKTITVNTKHKYSKSKMSTMLTILWQ